MGAKEGSVRSVEVCWYKSHVLTNQRRWLWHEFCARALLRLSALESGELCTGSVLAPLKKVQRRASWLQAIAKGVDTLPVLGYILDTHHSTACHPLPPYQCCTRFSVTFNQASLNIERGRRGLEGYFIIPWPFIVCYLREIAKILRVYQPFCNRPFYSCVFSDLVLDCKRGWG